MKSVGFILIHLLILKPLWAATIKAEEGRIIAQCLQRYGGPTLENAERLQRFKQWSDTYEEIPCFTSCYISEMFDFFNETQGFNEVNVIQHFGQSVFDVCKERINKGKDSCEIAYNGFHCMVNMESNPIILIDGMSNLNDKAKSAMKQCLHKFEAQEWGNFGDYSRFPVKEPITCFTRCFLDELQIFDHRLRKWKLDEMRTTVGFPKENVTIDGCLAMGKRRNRNNCAWMYREFTCFVKAI